MTNAEPLPAFETLWTAVDLARFLKCSRSLVYQKAEAGLLPCLRLGGLLRFDPAEIRRWLASSASPAARVIPIR